METNSRGFTIIEVMMFLAISALLLMGAFIASGNLIAGTRFTDSMRGLESFLQRQYEEVTSGVNPRGQVACSGSVVTAPGGAPPGASNCYLLGKVVVFSPNQPVVKAYNVIGSQPTGGAPAGNPTLAQLLSGYNPQSVPTSGSEYRIPWSAQFSAGRRSDSRPANAVAFLRNPTSSEVGTFHFQTNKQTDTATLNYTDFTANGGTPVMTAHYCVNSEGGSSARRGAIEFTRSQGSTGIQAKFDFTGAAPC